MQTRNLQITAYEKLQFVSYKKQAFPMIKYSVADITPPKTHHHQAWATVNDFNTHFGNE